MGLLLEKTVKILNFIVKYLLHKCEILTIAKVKSNIKRADIKHEGVDLDIKDEIEYKSTEELLGRNKSWYESYAQTLQFFTDVKLSPENILKQFENKENLIPVIPFYCVNKNTTEYLPTVLQQSVYTTNGCAAGNTPEEAIVQALSEVVERAHNIQILKKGITTPEIPDEILKKYTVAYEIISFLRENGLKVIVKDCSLGKKFPVVCVNFIDSATGKYQTHFGAYPVFEIALERALTETFQGTKISDFIKNIDFIYENKTQYPINEILKEMAYGDSVKKPNFFIANSGEEYKITCGFDGKNNKELLNQTISFFTEQGYDLLIRDCSCLNFPTYQVIIPGYSEVFGHRLSKNHNEFNGFIGVLNTVRNPSAAKFEDMLAFVLYTEQNKKTSDNLSLLTLKKMSRLAISIESNLERKILYATYAFVFYAMQRYVNAISYIQNMIPLCEPYEQGYLVCLKRYLSMKANKYDDKQILATLEIFHDKKTVDELYSVVCENRNPFEKFTLHCGGSCDDSCPLKNGCRERNTNRISDIIDKKKSSMKFDESLRKLQKIFKST